MKSFRISSLLKRLTFSKDSQTSNILISLYPKSYIRLFLSTCKVSQTKLSHKFSYKLCLPLSSLFPPFSFTEFFGTNPICTMLSHSLALPSQICSSSIRYFHLAVFLDLKLLLICFFSPLIMQKEKGCNGNDHK